jgi:hypothetical protein
MVSLRRSFRSAVSRSGRRQRGKRRRGKRTNAIPNRALLQAKASQSMLRRRGRADDALQARERTLEPLNIEDVGRRNMDVVHEDRTGCTGRRALTTLLAHDPGIEARTDARPQRCLVLNRRRRQTLRPLVQNEASDLAVPCALSPDDKDVGNGAVCRRTSKS